jgi:hypothetical protein
MRSVGALAGLLLVLAALAALVWTNPSGTDAYRQAVLLPYAKSVAAKWAKVDRQVVEEQAAKVLAAYRARRVVRADSVKLALLKTVPGLRMEFTATAGGGVGDIPTRLAIWKHQALIHITLGQESAERTLATDLALHTTRVSYGVASVYTTCTEGASFRYLVIARRFSALTPASCQPVR